VPLSQVIDGEDHTRLRVYRNGFGPAFSPPQILAPKPVQIGPKAGTQRNEQSGKHGFER